ncbi:MAG TPA: protein kinase, partial [Polyangium sp.]|nr:protein kinase [Polyangium sp.]
RSQSLARELAVANAEKNDALKRVDWALVGQSAALRQLQAQIASVAVGDEPIVLRSDRDCGAEAVARAIHAASPRRDRPFIVVDGLRLVPGSNVTDLLPFTKKTASVSRFDLADGGTLFINHLDRIQSSSLDDLAVRIDELVEARAAGRNPLPDTRIIAVTEEMGTLLPKQVAMSLRRLNVQQIHLPPLAARRDDIAALTEVLMRRQAKAWERTIPGIDEDSLKRMQEHDWPGNLRELEDVVARAVAAISTDGKLHIEPTLLQSGRPIGSYRLLRRLGSGGFGEVWEARHHLLARPAALKLILGSDDQDLDKVERFKREAAATARLTSPHTVTLYDFGVSETGQFYYVMELLQGIDLETLYQQFGVLSPPRLASFLVQACRSLAEAHHYGMIHRDIKPSNLFTCRLGMQVDVIKVLDFGLVRLQGDTLKGQLTQENMLLGTPAFLAPEFAMGPTGVETRSDIYSLAATAWTLATGKPLFTGRTPLEIIMKHLHVPPQAIQDLVPEMPKAVADIIMAGLAKLPGDRPTAQEMAQALLASGVPQTWSDQMRHDWWQKHEISALQLPKPSTPNPKLSNGFATA